MRDASEVGGAVCSQPVSVVDAVDVDDWVPRQPATSRLSTVMILTSHEIRRREAISCEECETTSTILADPCSNM